MTTFAALPGRPRRALAGACVLAMLAFAFPPSPAAAADVAITATEAPTAEAPTSEASATADWSVSLEGSPTVSLNLTPAFSPAPPAGTLTYQYLRDGMPHVAPSPHPGYRITEEDLGKRISVRISAARPDSAGEVVTSAETEPVLGYISGSAGGSGENLLGATLYLGGSVLWARPALDVPTATGRSWFRDGTPIPGAAGDAYTVTEADLGARITGRAEITAPGYSTWTGTTDFGTAIRGHLQLVADPVITWNSGTPYVAFPGTVLTASAPAVQAPAPAGVTYSYQWIQLDAPSGTPIAGATAPTYTVRTQDIGKDIRVTVTPVAANYLGHPKQSAAIDSLNILGRFTATAAPSIRGTVQAGQLLTAVPGTAPSPASDSVQYLWYRDGMRLTEISTDPTYRLTAADGGHKVTVKAFYNRARYVQAASPASAAVTPPGYFTLGLTPWITGTAATGYTVAARTEFTAPVPASSTFQWFRDGRAITGATGSSYRLTASDQLRLITFKVTFRRPGTVTATQTSRAIRPQAVFTKLPTPVVKGTFAAGQVLKATTALPYPAPSAVNWQWQRDGKNIPGATASSYRLTTSDRDKFIRVLVGFKKPNYLNAVRASAQRWVPGPTTVR
ncbi:hypothetical protein [Arthrobacter sp. SAFR-014]|uniref:hypothetical protein n=1 Tax=unclassified Arthrobacter TaxID=235627 RepID=UPI003F7B65BA